MRKGANIRLRTDGRYEARYIKNRDRNGKIIYGYCYGKTYEEAEERRNWLLKKNEGLIAPKLMNLLILGAGSHGKEVLEIAEKLRCFNKISFLDDSVVNESVLGPCCDFNSYYGEYSIAIPAVGSGDLRKKWTRELINSGFIIPTLVDPSAVVSKNCKIGFSTVICPGAVINASAVIGNGCIVSSGAIIGRDAQMCDWTFINSGETLLKEGNTHDEGI